MNPAILTLILSLVEEAIKLYPDLVADIKSIFNNPAPTPQDWEDLRLKVLAKTYRDYVPDTAIPPPQP